MTETIVMSVPEFFVVFSLVALFGAFIFYVGIMNWRNDND